MKDLLSLMIQSQALQLRLRYLRHGNSQIATVGDNWPDYLSVMHLLVLLLRRSRLNLHLLDLLVLRRNYQQLRVMLLLLLLMMMVLTRGDLNGGSLGNLLLLLMLLLSYLLVMLLLLLLLVLLLLMLLLLLLMLFMIRLDNDGGSVCGDGS